MDNVTSRPAGKKRSREDDKLGDKSGLILKKNVVYQLLSPEDALTCVGFGRVLPSQTCLHGKAVPEGYVVVFLTLIANPKCGLPIPNFADDPPQTTLGDAAQTYVAWPKQSIGAPKANK